MESVRKINIRGINFDNFTKNEAFEAVTACLSQDGGAKCVFTPNAEIVQMCVEKPMLFDIINSADIIIADGAGIVKAAEILETPIKCKIPGVELGERVIAFCAENSIPVFFLGGKPEVADIAVEKLSVKYPGLVCVGTHDGYFDKSGEESEAVIADINDSGAKLLIVCLGAPTQEKWVYENRAKLKNVRLCMALGGSIDVYSGIEKRAPKLFIDTNTEWLYRLVRHPSRIGRMTRLPKFILGTQKQKKEEAKKQ